MGPSSRLLVQKSSGHCSLSTASSCTQAVFRRFFVHGELPEDETMCEVDRPGYFPVPGVEVKALGSEEEVRAKKMEDDWHEWRGF